MRIYMLTATHPQKDMGGGGLHARELIRIGEQLGHRIIVYTELEHLPDIPPDFYWLSNMCGKFSAEKVLEKIGHEKYVVHEDAYSLLCPQPTREYKLCFEYEADTISMLLEDPDSRKAFPPGTYDIALDVRPRYTTADSGYPSPEELKTTYDDCSKICRLWDLIPLMSNCRAMVVDSPMHAMIWAGIYPDVGDKLIILDPPVPVDKFHHSTDKVPNTYAYVGTIAKGKGFDRCATFVRNRGGQLMAVGDVHHTIDMEDYKDVQYYGSLPYDSVPNFIRRCQCLIHLPTWPEPQGRIITEGLLLGSLVIGNTRVGALSYEWLRDYVSISKQDFPDFSGIMLAQVTDVEGFRDRIHKAPYKFWGDINDRV